MKKTKVSKQAGFYVGIMTFIAVVLLAVSVFMMLQPSGGLMSITDRSIADKLAIIIFFILAITLEASAVEMPRFGYTSLAFSAYFALIIKFDYPVAVIVAAFALLVREVFITKQKLFFRLANFSGSLITVCLSGVVFTVVNQQTPFMSSQSSQNLIQNLAAIILGGVAYYGLDKLFVNTITGLLDEETRTDLETARAKTNLYNLSIVPMAILLVATYFSYAWTILLALIPLFALRRGVQYSIREIDLVDQEELLGTIDHLKENLSTYQEQAKELNTDLNKKIDEMSILVEMSEALGTSVNLESTLEIVVSMIRKMMMYQSCVIFLIEKNSGTLVAYKAVTPYRDILEYSSLLKLEESIVNLVVQSKKPILIPDMQSMGEQRIFKDERSVICVPLIVKGEIIGVVYVGSTRPGTYNEDHLHLLSILGNAASTAVYTSQLYDEEQSKTVELERMNETLASQNNQFQILLDIGQKLGSSLNLEETQKIIIDGLENMFDYQTVALFLLRSYEDTVVLAPTRYRSPYALFFENLQMSLDDEDNILGNIAKYRKPLLLTDTRNTKTLQTILENERCVMLVPMVVENEMTGAIYVGHSESEVYSEEGLRLLEAVSHNAAMAIKNAEIYEREARRAITDGLTGLYTHRYFQERLTEEINHARRRRIGLALMMIDADHFKSLNDTCGHPEGDKCLKAISDIMRKYTRDSDLVCRIGGDEFVILLKEIDKKNAHRKAEDIRMAVQSKYHEGPVQITTSIGLACFPDDGDNKKDLVASADAALYQSKKRGRNRTTLAVGPVTADFKKEVLPRE